MKILSVLLVFSMLFHGSCYADESKTSGIPDVDCLSRNELLLLRSEIDALLSGEDISFVLPAGVYTCGVDFPAGSYSISPVENDWSYVDYLIFDASGENVFSGQLDYSMGLSVGKFEFLDGYIYEAKYGSSVFATFTGIKIK